jgi:hypothetical protein
MALEFLIPPIQKQLIEHVTIVPPLKARELLVVVCIPLLPPFLVHMRFFKLCFVPNSFLA